MLHLGVMRFLIVFWNIIHYLILLIHANQSYTNSLVVNFKVGYQYTYKWKIIQEMSNSYSCIDENIKNDKTNKQFYIIEGLANIISGENCDMRLSLHQVEEFEQNQINANFSHHLNYPIKFCLQNGKLLSFEYLKNDEIFFINLKKALLIQLQMSMQINKEQFYTIETDHLGSCQTEYTPKSVSTHSVTMIKKRNSTTCRDDYETASNKYYLPLSKQQSTVNTRSLYLHSNSICELTYLPNGPITNVSCHENSIIQQYWFTLFPIKTLTFNVYMQINLIEQMNYTDEIIQFNGISKMDFELPDKNELYTSTINNLLKENNIENVTYINLVINSPDKFDYFIKQFQFLTYEHLINVYNLWKQHNNKTNEIMSFFENIITEVQTESSMKFIINHFILNSTSLFDQVKWINSLSLLKKANIEFMKEIKKLLTNHLYNYTVCYVSMSIRLFCENSPSCLEYATIKDMVVIMETSIDLQDNTKLFKLLQAIDNLGHFLPSENVTSVVQKILNDNQSMCNDNLRLYTGQILGHFQCKPEIDKLLWSVLSNISESNQLRIIMFNSYSQCLTDEKMKKILEILGRSLDSQIRSYILSRLVSLLKTQDPSKILSHLTVQKYKDEIIQLNKNIGLFSRIRNSGYYEWLQRTKYGNFLMELSLIYNQNSIIPNTMMINLKYQKKDKFINIVNVLYLHGNESILHKVIVYLFKTTITSRYMPWMNDYSVYIDNQFIDFICLFFTSFDGYETVTFCLLHIMILDVLENLLFMFIITLEINIPYLKGDRIIH
ncbi:hypothetical protein MN116_001822 [Schistosoma mekongi]|uniref:Vitellogenin domain-containing protein n=1 Tax=Schistosoma mekongi TaxID=38744 RepID=A0AAE1ZJJ9_SCHME|nr:hypothetical protein MN116_001822 [Schistosoma mekongi]